jgi:hypothetical protein
MDIRRIACLAAVLIAALRLGSAHAQSCISDDACQDGSWCNGVERCVGNPGKAMCLPAPRPMCSAKKHCDETAKKCVAPNKDGHACPAGEAYSFADHKCIPTPPGSL